MAREEGSGAGLATNSRLANGNARHAHDQIAVRFAVAVGIDHLAQFGFRKRQNFIDEVLFGGGAELRVVLRSAREAGIVEDGLHLRVAGFV